MIPHLRFDLCFCYSTVFLTLLKHKNVLKTISTEYIYGVFQRPIKLKMFILYTYSFITNISAEVPAEPSLVLILKWGGELTPAGRIQAEELGRIFRCMYPGGQGRHLAGSYSNFTTFINRNRKS